MVFGCRMAECEAEWRCGEIVFTEPVSTATPPPKEAHIEEKKR